MSVDVVLTDAATTIVDEAYKTLHPQAHPHYAAVGERTTRQYLTDLFDQVLAGVIHREAVHLVQHAEDLAEQRFLAGFDLAEVQAEFNALEQSMWRCISEAEQGPELLATVGVLSAILGAGKDALARSYVRLATYRRAPHLDVQALYGGTDGEYRSLAG